MVTWRFALGLALSYLLGALPWSVWLGTALFQVDPRDQPDGNPGAANAFRAAGWRLGAAVLVLDFLKAFIPVALARWFGGYADWQLLGIAIMPTLGHAFSVFLRFRGGRGIVVMFGVWAGLTLYQIPLVMGLTAIGATLLTKRDALRTLAIPIALLVYLPLAHSPAWMIILTAVQLGVLLLKLGPFILGQRARPRSGHS